MEEFTKMDGQKAAAISAQAGSVANDIIDFLQGSGVPLTTGILAAGIAFTSGAGVVGMSLPTAIDLVRIFYELGQQKNEANH